MNTKEHRYFTTREAAEKLRLSPGTLNNMAYQKRGPMFFLMNGRRIYRDDHLDEYATANPVLTSDQHA